MNKLTKLLLGILLVELSIAGLCLLPAILSPFCLLVTALGTYLILEGGQDESVPRSPGPDNHHTTSVDF